MSETPEQVRADLEHLQGHAALEHARAVTARVKVRTALWSVISVVALLSAPAAVIFVYAALWGWLQR